MIARKKLMNHTLTISFKEKENEQKWGNDELYGNGGDDLVHGGVGNDFGDGGPNLDTCVTVETATNCEAWEQARTYVSYKSS